ncbi:hypothetical protein AVEN_106643-1 [Araneus ventricosus]|uniref:Uncharacterized protein n=1 Tax=Araneus ventricosus TaxID=182803 RepID=A0A4Y2VKN0_ARAVE|nr:hypothetical protein AVEN_106643-1 [Araneus ventricosus]
MPLQTSAPHQLEDIWPSTMDLTRPGRHTQSIFWGNQVANLKQSSFEVKTLLPDHRRKLKGDVTSASNGIISGINVLRSGFIH